MNKQTQKALDIAKEALFLIRASDPAYNAKTTYRVTNHERFGELLREFLEVEDRIRQAHTEQNLNKHLVGGPVSASVSEGEQLATEAVDTGVWGGERCPRCKGSDLLDTDDHWTHCQNCGFSFVGG